MEYHTTNTHICVSNLIQTYTSVAIVALPPPPRALVLRACRRLRHEAAIVRCLGLKRGWMVLVGGWLRGCLISKSCRHAIGQKIAAQQNEPGFRSYRTPTGGTLLSAESPQSELPPGATN